MSKTILNCDLSFLDLIDDAAHMLCEAWPERDTTIGTGPVALAQRVVVKRTPESCIYLHRWLRSDPDDLHDHPWDSVSLVLRVGYWEITPEGRFWREPGSVVFRKAEDRHRVELPTKEDRETHLARAVGPPVSLFITGIECREWGFHTAEGFVIGREYRSAQAFRERHLSEGGAP